MSDRDDPAAFFKRRAKTLYNPFKVFMDKLFKAYPKVFRKLFSKKVS